MCVVDRVIEGSEITSTTDDKFYPFDINVTLYGEKINSLMTTLPQSNNRDWGSVFINHLRVLNIFCVAVMQMKLKGQALVQYVMNKLKIDKQTSQYIRLFHNRNHGVCEATDYEVRINDALGLLLCVIYFSRQSSVLQR